ncbi:hypothetical protein BDZ89DRAFT_1127951 [Hymenopellis radicata]|nr:hypothetical protein BDZ89DRAFT_1127951 [Hymenopellis radicata]
MPSQKAVSFSKLMQRPFGPYNHTDILSERFYDINRRGPRATLRSVRMFKLIHGNYEDTGLSKTELLNSAADDVYFTGVLDIEDRQWLSLKGIDIVEDDILRRDQSIHLTKTYSKKLLKLNAIYASEPTFKSRTTRVKVLIKCKKCLLASFMTRNNNPDALVLATPTTGVKPCDFIVESMHVETHQMSERFLSRYRLHATVVDIAKSCASVPRHERTIQWLVSRIKENHHSSARKRIVANADEDSDYDEDGTTLRVPRRPRHLSSAEVRGILAKEAPWLLAQQLSRQPPKPEISITSLHAFCLEYSRIRPRATGQWKSVKAHDLEQICRRYLGWDAKTFQKRLHDQIQKELKASEVSVLQRPEASDDSGFENQDEELNFAAPGGFEIDSDASVASSSEASGSDAEGPAIPTRYFNLAPLPPAAGERCWVCPRKKRACSFKLDLLELAEKSKKRSFSVHQDARDGIRREWLDAVAKHNASKHGLP